MDEKIKEIEKSVEGEYIYDSNNPSVRVKQVQYLLSEYDRLEARVKELEDKLTILQDHANGMGEIISNQTKIRIGLEGELTVANEQVKGLEEEKSKMVKLSPENMKKLGWSYT